MKFPETWESGLEGKDDALSLQRASCGFQSRGDRVSSLGSSTASTRRYPPQPTRDESPYLKGYLGTLPGFVVTMSQTSDIYNCTQGCVLYVMLGNLGEKYNRQRKVAAIRQNNSVP